MKQQTKLIGILVILIALLAGAFVLDQNLSKNIRQILHPKKHLP